MCVCVVESSLGSVAWWTLSDNRFVSLGDNAVALLAASMWSALKSKLQGLTWQVDTRHAAANT